MDTDGWTGGLGSAALSESGGGLASHMEVVLKYNWENERWITVNL